MKIDLTPSKEITVLFLSPLYIEIKSPDGKSSNLSLNIPEAKKEYVQRCVHAYFQCINNYHDELIKLIMHQYAVEYYMIHIQEDIELHTSTYKEYKEDIKNYLENKDSDKYKILTKYFNIISNKSLYPKEFESEYDLLLANNEIAGFRYYYNQLLNAVRSYNPDLIVIPINNPDKQCGYPSFHNKYAFPNDVEMKTNPFAAIPSICINIDNIDGDKGRTVIYHYNMRLY